MTQRVSGRLGLAVMTAAMMFAAAPGKADPNRCMFLFDKVKPEWVAELQPSVRQSLVAMFAQMQVLKRAREDAAFRQEFDCGCYVDHLHWDELRASYPDWYREEPRETGKLADEWARLGAELREEKTDFWRGFCR